MPSVVARFEGIDLEGTANLSPKRRFCGSLSLED